MFGSFFDLSMLDPFVAQIARELAASLPPSQVDEESRQTRKRRDQLDERIRAQAERFVARHRLNVYQKAKLGIRVQEALRVAGYSDAFIEPFASALVRLVAVASSRAPRN